MKGQAAIVMIIFLVISIIIGVFVMSQILVSIDPIFTNSSTTVNNTRGFIESFAYNGFYIAVVLIVVIAVAAVLWNLGLLS